MTKLITLSLIILLCFATGCSESSDKTSTEPTYLETYSLTVSDVCPVSDSRVVISAFDDEGIDTIDGENLYTLIEDDYYITFSREIDSLQQTYFILELGIGLYSNVVCEICSSLVTVTFDGGESY